MLLAALKRIYSQDFNPITELEENLFGEFWHKLNEATERGYTGYLSGRERAGGEADYDNDFLQELRDNNGVFAAFKTHRMQNDMAAKLIDENGVLLPFEQWMKSVQTIADHQVERWFQTEYDTAVKRAHIAAEERQFEREADVLPNLEWIKTTSITPGADHKVFWGLIRPVNDDFWNSHKPGDRWGCKCSRRATDKEATPIDDVPVPGKKDNPVPGLDNNPAKDGQIFSDSHPYNPPSCAACTLPGRKVISKNGKTLTGRRLGFFNARSKKDCYHCSKPAQLIKKSVEAREREDLETAMEPLIKKNVIRYVGNAQSIKIKFSKSGNSHIANDVLKGIKLSKSDLRKLDELIREAGYVRSSKLYKNRNDNFQMFYYFKEKGKEIYYNIGKEVKTEKSGKVKVKYYAHAVTDQIPPKKRKSKKAAN